MKRYLSILFVLFLTLAICQPVAAQKKSKAEKRKEKAEKKLWKKKAKSYKKTPLSLRDDLETANKKLRELSERNKDLQNKFGSLENRIDSLQALLSARQAEIAALNTKYEKLQRAYETQKNINEKDIIPGLVYRVQIGAYVYFEIKPDSKDMDRNFEGETADGMNKYLIGRFRDLPTCEQFRDNVRKLGIGDAFVVPYIDGTRVTMEEAKNYQGGTSGRMRNGGVDVGDSSGKDAIKNSRGSSGKQRVKKRRRR
ncbi:MAG: hypothetical protein AAGN35_00890 [Bacteroidota bacterium]